MVSNTAQLNLDVNLNLSLTDESDDFADPLSNTLLNETTKYLTEDSIHQFFHLKTTASIKIIHLNCRSLKKKFTAVTALLNKCHPITALAVSELG